MRKLNFVVLAIALAVFFFKYCKPTIFTAPDNATLVVTVNPPTIPLGGQSIVRVVGYKSNGAPLHDGTVIFFSTDLGEIESKKKIESGTVEVLFRSTGNRSGVATLTITSGNAQTIPDSITITIGASSLNSLSMSADPPQLPEGGGFSTIRVTAYDGDLNPLPNIPVILNTTAGELNSKGGTITTGADGQAQDQLYTTETVEITAKSGDITDTLTVEVKNSTIPTASFVYSPTNPKVGERVYFNASGSSDEDGTIVSYEWSFGDGHSASGQTTEHRYNTEGTFQVVLTVRDETGNTGTSTPQSVTVSENDSPTAIFEISTTTPKVNEDVHFNASGSSDDDGTIVSYQWDFGDNTTDSGVTATHRYSSTGGYIVQLTVTDDSDNTGIHTKTITVGDSQKPTASFTVSPAEPKTNEEVLFDASGSTDSDGVIVSYDWDFGDNTTGTGQAVTHSYGSSGDYFAVLTVTDNDGNTGTHTQRLTIEANAPPQAAFDITPSAPKTNEEVAFDATKSTDPDGVIVSYQWDFGDNASGEGITATHSYSSSGTYLVQLTVTDDSGNTDIGSQSVTVSTNTGGLPKAEFVYSPTSPIVLDNVHFNASASSDDDGTIVSYDWDFGDGGTGSGETIDHRFHKAGTYQVVLTVEDNDGNTGNKAGTVTVTDNQLPTADFSYTPDPPDAGDQVTFSAIKSSDPDGTIRSWAWDFGDGSTASGETVTHIFSSAGKFWVILEVTDDRGGKGTKGVEVTVN